MVAFVEKFLPDNIGMVEFVEEFQLLKHFLLVLTIVTGFTDFYHQDVTVATVTYLK